MSTVLDYLDQPEFADSRLTESINVPPYETGRPAQLGIFIDTPITTTYVRLSVKDGQITIIPARERGGESNLNMSGDLQDLMIPIPHFPLDDAIRPSDLQNIMAFGEDYVFQTLAGILNAKLTELRSKHDATHSHLDWGALNGMVIDGEGKVLVDLYSKFELTPTVINFALNTASTDIATKNREAKAVLRRNLRGAATRGTIVLAGPTFFDRYTSHANVRESLKYYAGQTVNPARDDVEDTFTFAGLKLERIDEEFSFRLPNGTFQSRPAVKDDEAILLPLGTQLFKRYIAPPDTIADANTRPRPGDKVFVSTERLKHNKGEDIHTESNVLPICTRPEVIIKLKA